MFCAIIYLPIMKYSIDIVGFRSSSLIVIGGIVALIISFAIVKRISKSNLWSNLFVETKLVNDLEEEKIEKKVDLSTKSHINKETDFDFIEKQYLGLNKMSLSRRMSLAIFCLVAYYWRENHDKAGELYFFIGIGIMVISILLLFILHFETKIKNGSIILDGLWTSRKIKIDTASIVSVKKVKYSKYFLNRSVYNLHLKGTIRFYTRGIDAVELTDKDGLIYLIGSQKSEELTRVIQDKLK